jgi:hypothetical protein
MPTPGRWVRELGSEARHLTARQTGALLAVAAVTAALLMATALNRGALATALAGLLVGFVFVAVVLVRRRLAQEVASVRVHLAGEVASLRGQLDAVSDRLQLMQRQVVAAMENERLAASDRHAEVLAMLDRLETTVGRPAPAMVPDRDGHAVPSQRHR